MEESLDIVKGIGKVPLDSFLSMEFYFYQMFKLHLVLYHLPKVVLFPESSSE